ncbi:MAG: hypothetical protein J5487_02295 [Lachnospiraceae bacterium]|nr:hypothetical protein [Lachnospiraceae bacterium]
MKKGWKKMGASVAGSIFMALVLAVNAFAAPELKYVKNSKMLEYKGSYDEASYPYEKLDATFTTASITVDGVLEDAYGAAPVSVIDNVKTKEGYGLEPGNQTYGELRTLWDGPVLYLGISVYDDCVLTSTETKTGAVSNPAVAGTSVTTYPYASWGGFWATYAVTESKESCDSVVMAIDLYNDRTDYELDTAGIVTIDALGQLYYYASSNIPSLGSALGDPNHPEYMNIIKGYAAAPMLDARGEQIGYTVEVALRIEDLELNNGTEIGVDLKINDVNNVVTGYTKETVPNPDYIAPVEEDVSDNDAESEDVSNNDEAGEDISENDVIGEDISVDDETTDDGQTEENAEPAEPSDDASEPEEESSEEDSVEEAASPSNVSEVEISIEPEEEVDETEEPEDIPEFIEVDVPVYSLKKSADIFWSHSQDSLYKDFDHEHTKSLDWGVITLTGWNGTDEFAYSEWRITKILDYMNSASFAKGVYTAESQAALDAAVSEAQAVINDAVNDKTRTEAAATALENAFYGLKWGDIKYPDPSDLPKQVTLPNPYKFFGSERMVKNASDWEERRVEILDLAQFYEYGYKPEYDDLTIKSASYHKAGDKKYRWSNSQGKYVEDGTYTSTAVSITATVTVGEKSKDISFDVEMPTDEQIAASGHEGEKLPIVLSFDGSISSYKDAGLAMVTVPSVVSDTRTNDYAWNKRTGTFYDLYPYSRNGEAALHEVSNEMAEAWAASLIIDALELCENSTHESQKNAVADLAIEKLAVTGFSINGKYAFVAAVFDDRIDVCIPGAAGATGPSPWRYVYRGQIYDWSGTAYVSSSVDSYQVAWGTEVIANSVRHNRVRETELFRHFMTPGHFYAFEDDAYGYATRLPYDQNDLVATLAPRAIIIENTVNDYNDGCTADCLGAEIAKSVYRNLGLDADDLVKFNLRNLKSGDPHGNDSTQRSRSAEYLNYYFFGKAMKEATDTYLSTDPFSLNISNDRTQSPYDYYWGGFNTITGGQTGVSGTDGWYYYTFEKEPEVKNGFVEEDGTTYYYVDGKLAHAGLVDVGGLFYYIKGTGEVAKGSYYISNGNGIVDKGHAQFDAENGKMLINGIKKVYGEDRYYVDGVLQKDAGVVKIGAAFYYVDEEGKIVKTPEVEVLKANGLLPEGTYKANEKGMFILDGVYTIDGETAYYVNNKKAHRAGLVEWNGDYYYVLDRGTLATGFVAVTNTNGLKEFGTYEFDLNGKMIMKNGFVDEEGSTYYYINGRRGYAGLIEVNGDLYYVKGTGEIAKGHYYISNTNGLIAHKDHAIFGEDGKLLRFGKK